MVIKTCSKCKIEKTFPDEFRKNRNLCKECVKIYNQTYAVVNKQKISNSKKEYSLKNKDSLKEYWKIYYLINQESIKISRKEYIKNHKNDIILYKKKYYMDNKDIIKGRSKEYGQNNKVGRNINNKKYRANPIVKLHNNVSTLIRANIKGIKGGSIKKFLPYSIVELKEHIEHQFEPWMAWNNWGRYDLNSWDDNDPNTWKWQLDHIIPQNKLLYSSMTDENFQKCWALKNLRPYSAKQNVIDGTGRLR